MDVQGQSQRGVRYLYKVDDTVEHFVELLAFLLQGRLGKDRTELPHQPPFLAAQQNRADALQCTVDKYQAERTSSDCETDRVDGGFLSRCFMAPRCHKSRLFWLSNSGASIPQLGSPTQPTRLASKMPVLLERNLKSRNRVSNACSGDRKQPGAARRSRRNKQISLHSDERKNHVRVK